jgi:hypothetical protein
MVTVVVMLGKATDTCEKFGVLIPDIVMTHVNEAEVPPSFPLLTLSPLFVA